MRRITNRGAMGAAVAAVGVLGALVACSRSEAAPSKKADPAAAEPVALAAARSVDGKNFKLDMKAAGPCKATDECKVVVTLDALGDFHINKEYPYKFTAKTSPDVEYLGKENDAQCPGGKNIFTKCAGDFKQESEQRGVLTIRFKPSKPGTANVNGTYKMSVCSAQNCQLETHDLALDVTVDKK